MGTASTDPQGPQIDQEGEPQNAQPSSQSGDSSPAPKKRPRRKSTSHLKAVPESRELRESIKLAAETFISSRDNSHPFTKAELEAAGRELLGQLSQPEKYLGFVMVLIGNFFWKRQFLAIPFEKRMLLLPHCLKHAAGCPAEYDQFGLNCEDCGACSIADYKVRAEQLGYKVLVAEGSPVVLKIIVEGYVDGILGVACLNVLEKAIDKILLAGVPSYAVPLHTGDCKNTSLDEEWIWEVLEQYEPLPEKTTKSYLPVMRAANKMFNGEFETILPRFRDAGKAEESHSPSAIEFTERLSFDWLANGGKRFRPFITLAAYDACRKTDDLDSEKNDLQAIDLPLGVKRVAMAIEAFHKASLVHDDIEDDDRFRYGRETLHNTHGMEAAINVGDHLIGLGYHLINSAKTDIGADVACDILGQMSKAHLKLCDGQGAEMAWTPEFAFDLKPIDALKIYALKTSPAFEAALSAGMRMAGPIDEYAEMIPVFSRHLGVGFQILNDLKDWQGDSDNKLVSGQDAASLRPTLLLALALQTANDSQKEELKFLLTSELGALETTARFKAIFEACNVFETAEALIDKSRARAEALADDVEPISLRRLLYFLVDTVLAPEPEQAESPQTLVSLDSLGRISD